MSTENNEYQEYIEYAEADVTAEVNAADSAIAPDAAGDAEVPDAAGVIADTADIAEAPKAPKPAAPKRTRRERYKEYKPRGAHSKVKVVNVNTAAVAAVSVLAAIVIIMIAVLIIMTALNSAKEHEFIEVPAPSVQTSPYVQYGGYSVPLYEGVALNEYDPEKFERDENGRISYPGAEFGIDVSEYQGEIDWRAAAADGVKWASLRIGRRGYTEGGMFADAQFALNFKNAQAAGVPVGVYFFSQSITVDEAREEAQYVVSTLNGAELGGPVVYDWEEIVEDEARTDDVDVETLCAMANEFCRVVKEAGYKAEVYFNTYTGYSRYNVSLLTEADAFWLASYNDVPNFYYNFERWQYTHKGTVDGINANVDMNLKFN